jgi:transcription initiation factor TFIIIB Brf1 subunit/transcription initiation factor TFIIB
MSSDNLTTKVSKKTTNKTISSKSKRKLESAASSETQHQELKTQTNDSSSQSTTNTKRVRKAVVRYIDELKSPRSVEFNATIILKVEKQCNNHFELLF